MYIQRNDLILRYGENEIISAERNIGQGELATLQAIKDACEEVNSYIASRYALPLSRTCESVNRAVAVIARYYLHKSRPNEQMRLDYEDTIRWLRNVAEGKAILTIIENKPPSIASGSGIFVV